MHPALGEDVDPGVVPPCEGGGRGEAVPAVGAVRVRRGWGAEGVEHVDGGVVVGGWRGGCVREGRSVREQSDGFAHGGLEEAAVRGVVDPVGG